MQSSACNTCLQRTGNDEAGGVDETRRRKVKGGWGISGEAVCRGPVIMFDCLQDKRWKSGGWAAIVVDASWLKALPLLGSSRKACM